MSNEEIDNDLSSLNLQDLLTDESNDVLSEYLSVSIESLSEGTKVSVTTVEEQPAVYSATLVGVTVTDLQCLIDVPVEA